MSKINWSLVDLDTHGEFANANEVDLAIAFLEEARKPGAKNAQRIAAIFELGQSRFNSYVYDHAQRQQMFSALVDRLSLAGC